MTDAPAQHSALNTRDDLLAIAAAWPDLTANLGRETSGPGDGMPRAVTPTRGLVINEHISDVMSEVRGWVAFLGRVLIDETDWRPASSHTADILTDIARNRLGHFSAHADESMRIAFHDDAHTLRGKVTRAAYPDGYRTLDTRIPCDTDTCAGTYRVRPEASGTMPDLICSTDRSHRLGPAVWARVSWQKAGTA